MKFRRPWWNEAGRNSRRQEKTLWNIFRRYPTTENHVAFKRSKALARRIRLRSQKESWINFISSITSSTSSSVGSYYFSYLFLSLVFIDLVFGADCPKWTLCQ
ncbi:hypothetical protein AVEN_173403-1 [Araneus ventricosus]|uniref:Uncharacterized protein n=1 Tax=Araneus ventricosus TaxID=182803 RepID=A0A4Y2MZR0_ARAVE|nr:hypothetical protein AVEN_173403-1 [Araneus ventricosus]